MNQSPLQTLVECVSTRLFWIVVRWLLLGQYLCSSGLFLYERGWGQRNTQGHKRGSRQAAAFQDRQCESAIWLHQTGLDNKPPEYKGSTVLFHYFFYFPRRLARVADGLIPSNFSLCGIHMSFHPVHCTSSHGIPMWQLVSCIRCYQWNPTELRVCRAPLWVCFPQ